jgi:hypothetical protein
MTADQPDIIVHPIDPVFGASSWVVVGASVQGTSHIKISLPCQDAYAYKALNDSIIIAAVADGLGSAVNAQVGSQLAVDSAVNFIEQELVRTLPCDEAAWIQIVRDCFLAARASLEEAAQKSQSDLRDYSTTLILVVLAGDWLVTGHVGDGVAVAWLEDRGLALVSQPQNDEYVNVTYPLTMPDMLSVAEFKACQTHVKALALMSDGMQHVSIHTADNTPHSPFFEPLFRQLPGVKDMPKASHNLAEFMASEQINAHTDDDKTLVLIGRKRVNTDLPRDTDP